MSAVLFYLAPSLRQLFPDDMRELRGPPGIPRMLHNGT
jgi:hypothetical protein